MATRYNDQVFLAREYLLDAKWGPFESPEAAKAAVDPVYRSIGLFAIIAPPGGTASLYWYKDNIDNLVPFAGNSSVEVYATFSAFPPTGLANVIYIDKSESQSYYWNGALIPPAYVLTSSNVEVYANTAGFPQTGVENVIYIADDTNISYVWNPALNDNTGEYEVITNGFTPTIPTLQEVVDKDNTTTTNIKLNNYSAIEIDNGSLLKRGTFDYSFGISNNLAVSGITNNPGTKATFSGMLPGMTSPVVIEVNNFGIYGNDISFSGTGAPPPGDGSLYDTINNIILNSNLDVTLISGDGSQIPNAGEIFTFSGGADSTGEIYNISGWAGNGSFSQWSDLNGVYVKTDVAVRPSGYWDGFQGMHTPEPGTFNYYLQAPNSSFNGIAYFLAPGNRSGWGEDPNDNANTDTPVNYWRLCVISDNPYVYFINPTGTDPYTFPTTGWETVDPLAPSPENQGSSYLPNYAGGFDVTTITENITNGNGGISRICSVGYEDMWQAGIRHVFNINGYIRESTNCFNIIPTINFDISLRFIVGSRWILDNGDIWVCTDNTFGSAVWELQPLIVTNGVTQSTIKNTNVTTDIQLELPDKPTGSYTIATLEDVVGGINYYIDNGIANTYTVSEITTYTEGDVYLIKFINANTGTSTLNTKALKDTKTQANLVSGDIIAGQTHLVVYDGTNFQVLTVGGGSSTSGGILHATASGTDTYTASITGVTAYADGDAYLIRFPNGNTTAPTLNINTLGAKNLFRNNDGPLIGGDIFPGGEMICVYNSGTDGFQCIGSSPNSLFAYVTNGETSTISRGQVVYASGGTGDRMVVKLASNSGDATSAKTIGVVYSTSITANQKGIILMQGLIDGLSIVKPSDGWADGNSVYLGATAGSITRTKPFAPNHLVYVATVTTASNGAAGRMYVKIQNGYELDELHNVQAQSPSNKDTLYFDNTVTPNQWKTASISTILGYTPYNATNPSNYISGNQTITLNGNVTGSGTTTITASISDATVTGKVLTGYTSGAGIVAATDTILQAIQKLNGNISELVTGVSSVSGTTNRITATPTSGAVVVDIASNYTGQNTITTLGTITTGIWNANTIIASKGGTGISTYTIGDLLYADGATSLNKLNAVDVGSVLVSGGVGTAPAWSTGPTLRSIILNNASHAFTTTIQTSATQTATYTITLPTTAATGAQYLQTTGTGGTLQWTSGTTTGISSIGTYVNGTGRTNGALISGSVLTFGAATASLPGMVDTGTQTFAGSKTFSSAVAITATSNQLVLSSGASLLTINSGTSAAARTYLVPDAGATASFIMTAGTQSLLGSTTFSVAPTASVASVILSGTGSASNASQLEISGATMRSISFGSTTGIIGTPTLTTRTVGTKLIFDTNISSTTTDIAIGVGSTSDGGLGKNLWFGIPLDYSARIAQGDQYGLNTFSWYGKNTNIMELKGDGQLILKGYGIPGGASGVYAPLLSLKTQTRAGVTVTNASGDGSAITYTAAHSFYVGSLVTVAGVNPAGYNITGRVDTITSTTFTITGAETGAFVTPGTATQNFANILDIDTISATSANPKTLSTTSNWRSLGTKIVFYKITNLPTNNLDTSMGVNDSGTGLWFANQGVISFWTNFNGAPTTIVNYITFGSTGKTNGYPNTKSAITITDGWNIVFGTAAGGGTQIGTATTQLLAFYGATPIVRPSAYNQTAFSGVTKVHTASTYVAPTGGTIIDTQARTSLGQLAADVTVVKNLINSVIDDLQVLGLVG